MKRTEVLEEVREDTMIRRTLRRAVAGVLKEATSLRNGVGIPELKRNDSAGSQNRNNEPVSERPADSNRG
jgi:hypothetical protein